MILSLRKLVFPLFILCSIPVFSQDKGSPYSFFGLGEEDFKGNIETHMMQNVAVYSDSLYINLTNPASLSKLRVTNYALGTSFKNLTLKTEGLSDNVSQITINYFYLGFPISKKSSIVFGILPHSSISYSLKGESVENGLNQIKSFSGEGGEYRGLISYGIEVYKNLSLGMSLQYSFGQTDHTISISTDDLLYMTRTSKVSTISGLGVKFALNYTKRLFKDYELYSSLVYTPFYQLESKNEQSISSAQLLSTTNQLFTLYSEDLDLKEKGLDQTDITLTSEYSIALGLGKSNVWFAGIQYDNNAEMSYSNAFFNTGETTDNYSISLGGFYVPKYNAYQNVLKKSVYRAGFQYKDTGLIINDEKISILATSIGIGIPISIFSKLNFGFEYLNRGTTNAGLVSEDAFNFHVGFTFGDLWFIKRKYN